MAKKTERAAKPVSKSDRWTVRGVPAKLQKAAGDAARARGLTLGQWLGEVLSSALPRRGGAPAEATERWEAGGRAAAGAPGGGGVPKGAASTGVSAAAAARPS